MNHLLNGADKKIRTSDLRITNAPLYQLSYIGSEGRQVYSNQHSTTTSLWLNICLHVFQLLLTSFRMALSYRPCLRIRRMYPHQQHVDQGGANRVCTSAISGKSLVGLLQVQVREFRVQSAGSAYCEHDIFPGPGGFRGLVAYQHHRLKPGSS